MNALVKLPPAIAKLIPRLASDHDGEIVATARAMGRTLKAAGRDWHDVAAVCERGHERPYETRTETRTGSRTESRDKTWREVAIWCRDNSRGRLNEREFEFVRDMTARLVCGGEPTEKQATWLRAIYARLGGGR